jgi:prepilin-type N-terminal cleavage/methylation domain-containing protein
MLKANRFRTPNQKGFTLVEVVAAVGILASVMIGFSTLLGSVGAAQQIIERERVATRALSNEVEKVQSIKWDDLMPRVEGSTSCSLDNIRTSYPAITPGPEVLSEDRVNVTVTRTLKWHLSDTLITCDDTSKDRAEPKSVSITVTWDNGRGKTMTLDTKVVRSRWSEGPTNYGVGTRTTLAQEVSMASAADWCQSYTDGSVSASGGAATSTGTTIVTKFGKQNAICGISLTGLTQGKVYTAVMKVYVPVESQPVELAVQGGHRGGVAPADGEWYTLTTTWTHTGSAVVVGPKIQTGVTNPGFSEAVIQSLKIFQH